MPRQALTRICSLLLHSWPLVRCTAVVWEMTKEHPTQQIYQVIAAIVPSQSSIALSPSFCANGEYRNCILRIVIVFELTPIIILCSYYRVLYRAISMLALLYCHFESHTFMTLTYSEQTYMHMSTHLFLQWHALPVHLHPLLCHLPLQHVRT